MTESDNRAAKSQRLCALLLAWDIGYYEANAFSAAQWALLNEADRVLAGIRRKDAHSAATQRLTLKLLAHPESEFRRTLKAMRRFCRNEQRRLGELYT
jgi:hypothetical protein